jgi:threonyl-tRNA synthetase
MKNQQNEEQLTPEELDARRDEMKQFYEKSLPYLEAQSKYEKLLTEIEEARYKRATMQLNYAGMMAAAQGPDLDDEDEREDLRQDSVVPPRPVQKPEASAPATGKKLKRG